MVKLKCSQFIHLNLKLGDALDIQVRQFQNEDRIIYLGQGGSVIQIPQWDLPEVIHFLNRSRELELNEIRDGWLK